jgi:hypothetical protein
MEGSGSNNLGDPDPGGPKIYGFYRSGSGSGTLEETRSGPDLHRTFPKQTFKFFSGDPDSPQIEVQESKISVTLSRPNDH